MQGLAVAYLAVVCSASLVAFVMYGYDKRQARRGGWRVPEKSLHVLALIGGWPGAIAGQKTFRHKTQKLSFRLAFWCATATHIALTIAVVYGILQLRQGS